MLQSAEKPARVWCMAKTKSHTNLNVRVSTDLLRKFRDVARSMEVSTSHLVRHLIRTYLEGDRK
jgi:metal-responsive CopG/Arc/MetJ family transcriptional regulator